MSSRIRNAPALEREALRLLANYGEDVVADVLPLLSDESRARVERTMERRRAAFEAAAIDAEETAEKISRGRNARVSSNRMGLL